MRLRRRSCLLGFPLLMLALATGRARAAPEPDVASAGIFLRTFGGDAIAIIADRSAGMADRARRFDALFRSCFAIDTVAALVLGRRWKTASAGERAEFTELFAAYVVAAYARRFDAYAGERLVFGQGRPEGRDVVVASWIETRMGNVAVDWRVRRTGGGAGASWTSWSRASACS